jgi:glycosyltransferase involved in cell wall biosynthesis
MTQNYAMAMQRILHLYSNHKWTGPADHALNLVSWLQPHLDVQAYFACSHRLRGDNQLAGKASHRNIPSIEGLFLRKHLQWRMFPDIFHLKQIIAGRRIDIIHSHQDNDSLTAVLAGYGACLIRTCYDGEPTPLNLRQRFFFHRTAKIMTASRQVQANLSKLYPDKDIEQIDIPVDLHWFRPLVKKERILAEFGFSSADPIAGIVARVQPHRNFALLLDAVEQVVKEIPQFKFLIVGRGTHLDTLARRPVEKRGLEKNIVFCGYREDDYREVLNLFDYKVFLTPGSDGSCRAVREALACGKPVIASRKGILPELIRDGKTGFLVSDQPTDLARAMLTLTRDADLQKRCAQAARRYSLKVLNPDRYVKKVLGCYESMVARGRQPRQNIVKSRAGF